MSDDVEFKWRNRGFYELRSAPKVVDALERMGRHITNEANRSLAENSVRARIKQRRIRMAGYRMTSEQGERKPQGRWQVRVYTSSNHAKASNARHDTLRKLLSGER